jgi:hypothetical protein
MESRYAHPTVGDRYEMMDPTEENLKKIERILKGFNWDFEGGQGEQGKD